MNTLRLLSQFSLIFFSGLSYPHSTAVSGSHTFDWHNESISRIVAPSFSWNNLGVTVLTLANGKTPSVEGKACVRSPVLDIDIRDSYGFDINEKVVLNFHIDVDNPSANIYLS
jgi:hypothetical protein